MRASTQYTDIHGTAAADIIDATHLKNLAESHGIDLDRYDPVGISLYGVDDPFLSFICVDKHRSTKEKAHIVKLHDLERGDVKLSTLFQRLHIVMYDKHRAHFHDLDYDEEVRMGEE